MGKLKTESPGFQGELTFPKHWFLSIKRSCPCLRRHWDKIQGDVCLLSMLIPIILLTRSVAVTRVNLWKGLCGLSVYFLWTLRLFCFHAKECDSLVLELTGPCCDFLWTGGHHLTRWRSSWSLCPEYQPLHFHHCTVTPPYRCTSQPAFLSTKLLSSTGLLIYIKLQDDEASSGRT